jgi:hypothetical protein
VTTHVLSSGSSFLSGGTSAILFGGIFALIGLLGLFPLAFVIVVVANRAEPDPRGMRPFTVYLFGMTFVTLMLAYAGVTTIVTALLSLIGPHPEAIADGVGRSVVIGALFLIIAGGVMHYHLRKGLDMAHGDGRIDGPNARILHTYIALVSFIFVGVGMVSLGVSIYLLFQLAGPGVFGGPGSSTSSTLRLLLDLVYLMVASGVIVLLHMRMAPLALRERLAGTRSGVVPGAAPGQGGGGGGPVPG